MTRLAGPAPEDVFAEIRARIAFEHMIVATLIGAAASGAVSFFASNALLIFAGGWTLAGLVSSTVDSIWLAMLVFLIGFGAAIVIGMPLHAALERARIRRLWPWVIAAIGVAFAAIGVFAGQLPDLADPSVLVLFLPGVLIALLFWRRMRLLWRATEPAPRTAELIRIH